MRLVRARAIGHPTKEELPRMNTQLIQRQYDEVIARHYDLDPQSVLGSSLNQAASQLCKQDLLGGEEPLRRQHAGVRLAGADIVAIKTTIETDRLRECLDAVVRLAAEAAAPGLLAHGPPSPPTSGPERV